MKGRRVSAPAAMFFIVAVFLVSTVQPTAAHDDRAPVVPPSSAITRALYAGLAAGWWQWAASIPAPDHPLSQQGQVDCGQDQPKAVWFLGGVVNAPATLTRSCDVPFGKPLFFAVINVECSTLEPPPFFGANKDELRSCADGIEFSNVTAEIDGVPVDGLRGYRVTSPAFRIRIPTNNILGLPGPDSGLSVASGVHLLVPLLSPGDHSIHFTGTFTDFGVSLDITYLLTVQRTR